MTTEAYRKFEKEWCFDHVTSSPHYPKSNGLIERTVKTVKMTLKKAKSSKLDPYLALLCIRTTPVDNVLPSPAEMLYTRKVQGNFPVRMRNKLGEQIYERLQQRQEVQRTNHEQHSGDVSPLFPGQNVRIQTLPSSLWSPAVVREKCQEPRSYVVETQNGRVLQRNRCHIRGVESEKKTVRCECDSPKSPTVCDSRKVRFEDENRKTQPTVHNYIQKLSGSEANSDVPLHVTRSPAVMDRDRQYKTRTGRMIRKPRCYDQ